MMTNSSKFTPAIEIDKVTVRYHHAHKAAIKNITASIPKHTLTALVGPNGSGKSTLIKAIVGLVEYQGTITINSGSQNNSIGFVPQRHTINTDIPITCQELLRISYPNHPHINQASIKQALQLVDAANFYHTPINELSGGQLQRVLIARGLLTNPSVVILDEPEAGIDSQGEISFYQLLTKLKKSIGLTILLASHEIDMVKQYADFVICLNKHVIASGDPKKTLTKSNMHTLFQDHHVHH